MSSESNLNNRILKSLFILFILIYLNVFADNDESFDYHREESPAISWNGVQMFDARLMSLGGISFLASEPFAASINPAMIPSKSKLLFGTTLNNMTYEAFQYWGINQGVEVINNPLSEQCLNTSGFACSFTIRGVRFSTGWAVSNLVQFPSFDFRKNYSNEQYYSYNGSFSGKENTFYTAAAFKMSFSINIGFKLELIYGKRDLVIKDLESFYYYENDNWILKPLEIKQEEYHKFTSVVPSVGLTVDMSPSWMIGATLVFPLNGRSKRTITRSFINSTDSINISNTTRSTDTLYSPAKIYLGTRYSIPIGRRSSSEQKLILALESKYTLWSGYKYIFFEEKIPRNMRNTLVLSFGTEYGIIFSKYDIFFRLGYRRDPQPVLEPKTTLTVLTGGLGFRFEFLMVDFGFSKYSGTAGGIEQNHSVINGTLSIKIKGD